MESELLVGRFNSISRLPQYLLKAILTGASPKPNFLGVLWGIIWSINCWAVVFVVINLVLFNECTGHPFCFQLNGKSRCKIMVG